MKPKVLIVEDDKATQDLYRAWLRSEVDLLFAATFSEAFNLFQEHKEDLAAIAVDGSFPIGTTKPFDREAPIGPILVSQMRWQGFEGPLIAISHDEAVQVEMLKEHLCDHKCDKKGDLPGLLFTLLDLRQHMSTWR